MSSSLPRSTPAAQGVAAAGIEALLDALAAAPGVEMHGLVVVRHGHVVADGWWAPYSPDRVHLLYSLSKSFTSAAAGFAVAEGLLDLDATVLSYFPEHDAQVTDPRSRAMRVRDVAAMASGHLAETADEAFREADPALAFLRIPPDRDPGTVFAYNQPCTYTLAAIVQRLGGTTLTDYLRPRLFEPLGIVPGGWQRRDGLEVGFSGFHLTTEAVARFGQCLLDDGRREGRQVLPAGWVAEATREHVPTAGSAGEAAADADGGDWAEGYGQQFWRSRHGYRGDGAYGQFCVVVPEADLVVATTGASDDMQAVLDALWTHLLPALSDDALAPSDADDRLAARLAALALPAVPGDLPDVPDGTRLTLGGTDGLRGVTGAVLHRAGAAWTLDLDTWDGSVAAAPVGTGTWVVTEPDDGTAPVAVSAGSPAPGVVRADVLLLETPHRLRLEGDVAGGTLTAAWVVGPLSGVTLRSMAPR